MKKKLCVIAAILSALSLLLFAGAKILKKIRRGRYI
jgi:hypothetical protein